ncbi:hypothetical protein EYF80_021951 [Liparis tanakae]|uniref:Uncharacterized protein n=1 Tax=Liparis tanakae TaxID=230148 RepID=A0A4Z2HPU4_9TELE|nr:hypothetical protein EYF80_021951 [Liparis tanakae]
MSEVPQVHGDLPGHRPPAQQAVDERAALTGWRILRGGGSEQNSISLESVRDSVPCDGGFVSPSLSSSLPPSVWSKETLSRALLRRCISSSPWGDEKLRAAMVERGVQLRGSAAMRSPPSETGMTSALQGASSQGLGAENPSPALNRRSEAQGGRPRRRRPRWRRRENSEEISREISLSASSRLVPSAHVSTGINSEALGNALQESPAGSRTEAQAKASAEGIQDVIYTTSIQNMLCIHLGQISNCRYVLPASACVSSNQLQHFGHIVDGSIRDNEDLARIGALHWLLPLVRKKPDTLLLRQRKELTYCLIRNLTKQNRQSNAVQTHLLSINMIQLLQVSSFTQHHEYGKSNNTIRFTENPTNETDSDTYPINVIASN